MEQERKWSKNKPCLRRSNVLETIRRHISQNREKPPTLRKPEQTVPPQQEAETKLERQIREVRLEVKLLQRKLWEEEYDKIRPKPKHLKPRKNHKKSRKAHSMAVLHKLHPLVKLEPLQIELIEAKIVVAIDELSPNHGPPQFRHKHVSDGVLFLECANGATREFLEFIVADLEGLWEWSSEVELVEARDVGRWFTVSAKHSKYADESTIRHRLRLQNPELRTQYWRVIDTKATEFGWETVFRVDDKSFGELEAGKFTAFWGCGIMQFEPVS